MTYSEASAKLSALIASTQAELDKLVSTEQPGIESGNAYTGVSSEDMAKISHTGANMNVPAYLRYCIFDMNNEVVKWMGHTPDAPEKVKVGYKLYCYERINTMNYTLGSMIGTPSENFARKKYMGKIEPGGEQFYAIIKDFMI